METVNDFEFIYDDYKKNLDGDIDDFIFSVAEDIKSICEK